jgi:hypothetical protein
MTDIQDEFDLNQLLDCCRRELALRRFVYAKRVGDGKMSEKKAQRELELMQQVVDYFIDAIFRHVTGQGRPPSKARDWRNETNKKVI